MSVEEPQPRSPETASSRMLAKPTAVRPTWVACALAVLVGWPLASSLIVRLFCVETIAKMGQLGDTFGVVTAVMAAIAAYFTWKTYLAQKEQLAKLEDEEARRARLMQHSARINAHTALYGAASTAFLAASSQVLELEYQSDGENRANRLKARLDRERIQRDEHLEAMSKQREKLLALLTAVDGESSLAATGSEAPPALNEDRAASANQPAPASNRP